MEKERMKIEITFETALLGTISGNPDVAGEFIEGKHPDGRQPDEIRANEELAEAIEKMCTGFSRNTDNKPIMWDYQFKGFFKSACETMLHSTPALTKEERKEDTRSQTLKKCRLTEYLHKKTIDTLIFVYPREIPLILPEGGEISWCERSCRGRTQQGERIFLIRSEEAPVGTKVVIEIKCKNASHQKYVEDWLDDGIDFGMLQWRSGGKGRFSWRKIT